jgi:hypothetical protein
VEDRLLEGQTDEPAQQKVVAQLLDQALRGGDRVEDLDELRLEQILGSDRGTAQRSVERIEFGGSSLRGRRRASRGSRARGGQPARRLRDWS